MYEFTIQKNQCEMDFNIIIDKLTPFFVSFSVDCESAYTIKKELTKNQYMRT